MLFIGFVADFKGGPTVLMIGGPREFLTLASTIEDRRAGPITSLFHGVHLIGLDLYLSYGNKGALRRSDKDFYWTISDAEADLFWEQLRVLSESAFPAHAYLDNSSVNDGIQVMASIGEYDPRAIFGL